MPLPAFIELGSRRARQIVKDNEQLVQTYCQTIIALFALGFVLIELSYVLLPLLFAGFLSLLFFPLIEFLTCRSVPSMRTRNLKCRMAVKNRLMFVVEPPQVLPWPKSFWNGIVNVVVDLFGIGKIPRPIAAIFSVLCAFGVLALAGWIIYQAVQEIYARKDAYSAELDVRLQEVAVFAAQYGIQISAAKMRAQLEDLIVNNLAVSAARTLASFISSMLLCLVFLIFILFARHASFAEESARVDTPWDILRQKAQNKVQRYIVVKTCIALSNAVVAGLLYFILDVPFPLVFALLTFMMNFVPSIGAWISTLLPLPVILFDPGRSLGTALLALALPGAAHVIIGDFIEPHFLGRLCQVSPIVVLWALLLFGYVWGIAGMVLSIPITIVVKLVFKQIPHPIPRYIAGIIYGDFTKYKDKLDRDMRLLSAESKAFQHRRTFCCCIRSLFLTPVLSGTPSHERPGAFVTANSAGAASPDMKAAAAATAAAAGVFRYSSQDESAPDYAFPARKAAGAEAKHQPDQPATPAGSSATVKISIVPPQESDDAGLDTAGSQLDTPEGGSARRRRPPPSSPDPDEGTA